MRFRTYSCLYEYFLNWPIPASFCLFSSFTREASVYDVLGTRTRGGRWKAQTNPLSYGGIPIFNVWFMPLVVVYVVKFKEDFTLASFSHQELNWGMSCGSVGRAVASNTKDLQFESSHRQFSYWQLGNGKNNDKEGGLNLFKKYPIVIIKHGKSCKRQ